MPVPTRGGCTPKEEWPWPRHSPSPGTRHTDKQWKYTYHDTHQEQEWVGGRKSATDSMLSKAHKLTAMLSSNKQTGTATLSSATITLTSSRVYLLTNILTKTRSGWVEEDQQQTATLSSARY